MSDERIAEIKARVDAATPGPWESGNRYSICGVMPSMFGEGRCAACAREGEPIWVGRRDINGTKMLSHVHAMDALHDSFHNGIVHYDGNGEVWHVIIETDEYGLMALDDQDFIANAREDIPYLLAEIERLSPPLAPVLEWRENGFGKLTRKTWKIDSDNGLG